MNAVLEEFDPIQYQFATYVIEYVEDIYDKYEKSATILGSSVSSAIRVGMAGILRQNDFFFFKMFKDIDFNYDLTVFDLKDEFGKILQYHLKNATITYTTDHVIIDDKRYSHYTYMDLLPNQGWILEFVGLALIKNLIKRVSNKIGAYKDPEQKLFTADDAADFMGYKKSYIYKLKSLGKLKSFQNAESSRLLFKKEDLESFMLRHVGTSIEEMM